METIAIFAFILGLAAIVGGFLVAFDAVANYLNRKG